MEDYFGHGWEIIPAGGATGEAFYAQHEENRYFLKRNTSPFLASLSAEGIVPKLVWTKRLETGDVFTAQQWLNGRELKPAEMNQENVAKLLKKIHQSSQLLSMLKRLGKAPIQPIHILQNLHEHLDEDILININVQASLNYLNENVDRVYYESKAVCHCDVNHNNWLLDESSQLYLIDWDGAVVGDPAMDIGSLLYWYISRNEWQNWLNLYGMSLDDHLELRMKWYVIAQTLQSIQWHKDKARITEMNKWIGLLQHYLTL